jgi:hypothetical protein
MPRIKYTDKQKIETLKVLMKFDGDLKKTAAFTGIPYRTIQTWSKNNIVKQSIDKPEEPFSKEVAIMVADIESISKAHEEELLPKLYQSINKTLEKGNDLLDKETDLNKISLFLKTISEAANMIKPGSDKPNNLLQFVQLINNQYVGNKEKEKISVGNN